MSIFPSHNKTNKSIPQNAKSVRWHATDAERAMLVFRRPSAPCFSFSSSTISERKKCLCLNHCCRDVCDCSLWLFWLLAFCSSVTENCLICVTVKRTLSWYSVMQNKWRRRGFGAAWLSAFWLVVWPRRRRIISWKLVSCWHITVCVLVEMGVAVVVSALVLFSLFNVNHSWFVWRFSELHEASVRISDLQQFE